jgi:HK97 family phage major capsid protein
VTPRDMRAKAAEFKAKAQTIYDAHKGDDAPEFTADELRDFDAATTECDSWTKKAEEWEAREKRLNDLDARNKASKDGGRDERPDMPHTDPKNTRNGLHGYSLLKALRQSDPMSKAESLDGIELETHRELCKQHSRSPNGLLIPMDTLTVDTRAARAYRERMGIERRDVTLTTGAGAVYEVVSPTMIEMLRNAMLAQRLGVRYLTGLQGNFSMPRQSGTGTGYWVTEGNSPTESNQTVNSVDISPSTLGAFTDYSRAFLKQTAVDAEQFVREDLSTVLSIELDRTLFNGSGSGAEPEGIIPNANVNVVAIGTNGGPMTWAKLVEMEQDVETQNALNGRLSFVSNPKVRASFKTITRVASSTFGDFLWADANEVNGYPAFSSNQIPSTLTKGTAAGICSAAIFGDFTQAIIATWGTLDVLVDPYTGGTAGNVRIVELMDADIAIRLPKAFSVCKDITTP